MKRICLLSGRHTPGSDWERECRSVTPRNGRNEQGRPLGRATRPASTPWSSGRQQSTVSLLHTA